MRRETEISNLIRCKTKKKMEREIVNFIRVWAVAIASACYSYSLTRILHIPKGIPRLIFILPVIYLFIVLPSSLSSFHLGCPTIFYLVWLAAFKLIVFSFDIGPLCTHPIKSLLHFVCVALLPIKVKDKPRSPNDQNSRYPPCISKFKGNPDGQFDHGRSRRTKVEWGRLVLFCAKLLAFALVIKIYDYKENLPSFVILANYCCHLYLGVEITLAVSVALVRVALGLELDPQFNEPYLTTSLQDFWGRRWNLMVSNILRLSVYNPIRQIMTPWFGRRWATVVATLAAFTVSGLMHEVIFFYFTRVHPTWEVTCFFILHGVCTAAEVVVKGAIGGRFRLHRLVSGFLTIGFVGVTAVWLFLPQILRNGVDVKVINEYPVMIDFVKHHVLHLLWD